MATQTEEKRPSLHNQSTEKALSILELLADASEPVRLRDLSQALSINPSTALRFLTSLQNCGYVSQEPESQRYFLTYKICRLAHQVSRHNQIQAITHPYLIMLSEKFGEAVCVSVERDMMMVYVDVASGPQQTLMSLQRIGNVSPMHCTGNGKLLLLNYSSEKLDAFIRQRGLPQNTVHTITTRQALDDELAQIRRQGFALDNEECEIGVRCMACPIYDYTGAIVAGISVTGPVSRMTDDKLTDMRAPLEEVASEISAALGFLH